MDKSAKIYVVHHHDIVGAGIVKALKFLKYNNLILKTTEELDLMDDIQVRNFFKAEEPEYVFCFPDSHGGIIANINMPAQLIYTNLKIQTNIIHNSFVYSVKKLLFMCGSCVYPFNTHYPIIEDNFMSGKMEPTSEAYSTARAAGIVMCLAYNKQYGTNFIPAILTNYYGEGDDFSENGHVLASVMKKMHIAKKNSEDLTLWGDGTPKRQFMFIDDISEAAILIMNKFEKKELINIAGGREFSIKELTDELRDLIGYEGKIIFDSVKPNGAMRKLLDNSKLKALGFKEKTEFKKGLRQVYDDFIGRNSNE